MKPIIVILGPTATGKTKLAVHIAQHIGGEILSADSRQVYKGMDIGTGKDLAEYKGVNYHLIDILEAGQQYSLFNYKNDFEKALEKIRQKDKWPVVCGGSGMYLEVALGLYNLKEVKVNNHFRERAEKLTNEELISELEKLKKVHNKTDFLERDRLLRALEIALEENSLSASSSQLLINNISSEGDKSYHQPEHVTGYDQQPRTTLIYGVDASRQEIRETITKRLKDRLNEGLIEEVKVLHSNGLSYESLKYYGLEYKYIAMYLLNELDYNQMFALLNTAIHQFAKRQMTWYRRMEKRGIKIKWLPNDSDVFLSVITEDIRSSI